MEFTTNITRAVLSIADFLLKKTRGLAQSDPDEREKSKSLKEELALNAEAESRRSPSASKADCSLIKSAPIDIASKGNRTRQSSSLELTDEHKIIKITSNTSIEKKKRIKRDISQNAVKYSVAKISTSTFSESKTYQVCNHTTVDVCSASTNDDELKVVESVPRGIAGDQENKTESASESNVNEESTAAGAEELLDNTLVIYDSGICCSGAASLFPSKGKHGSLVPQIKAKTGDSVYVRRHSDSVKQKICAVEGTPSEIEAALEMMTDKVPDKSLPNSSIQDMSAELYQRLYQRYVPQFLQRVELVNEDTIKACSVSAQHLLLQRPLRPAPPSLRALHRRMAATYQNPAVPSVPLPVKEGFMCVVPADNGWYRALVIATSKETGTSAVKLVDFGTYLTLPNDRLKQIRCDFMTLPFQATELLLASSFAPII